MDKEFIEMCKTDIIQKQWKKEVGDRYYCPDQTVTIESDIDYSYHIPEGVFYYEGRRGRHGNYEFCEVADEVYWLPTQNQLQEMLIPFELPENCESLGTDYHNLAFHFGQWILNNWNTAIRYKTMEQLWLGYYMFNKYGLIWQDNKWIKK